MPPREADYLTVYQARLLLASDDEIKGVTTSKDSSAVRHIREQYLTAKREAVANLKDGKLWHSS